MAGGAFVLRQSLWPLSALWTAGVATRNLAYDVGLLASHALPVPVVSVGNLTVGGTGKTPMVVWLVERALELGRVPGVLARGYGRAPGASLNDEGMLLRGRFPGLAQVQDPDRVRGGRRLCDEFGVDLVILDDGFQHRRIRRSCDIVCMDARRPFAQGSTLPAGDLREPRGGLRRADLVVLTRAGRVGDEELASRCATVRRIAGKDLPVHAAVHRPSRLRLWPQGVDLPLEDLRGRRVCLLSAIARPSSFRATALELGAEVVEEFRWRDHHVYRTEELAACAASAREKNATLLTTEKDAVKLGASDRERLVLHIELHFPNGAPEPHQVGLIDERPPETSD